MSFHQNSDKLHCLFNTLCTTTFKDWCCLHALLDYLVISLLPGQNLSVSHMGHRSLYLVDIMGSAYFGWIWHFWAKMFGYVTCFITIFSRRAKHFELNFCIREPFPWMVKPDRQEIILVNDKLAWCLACNEIPDMKHSRSNSTFNNIFRTHRFLRKCDVNIFWISSLCTLCWKKMY